MKKFENIDYFAEAFNIKVELGTVSGTGQIPTNPEERPTGDETEEDLEFFGGIPGGLEEAPVEEDNSVRDWVLRRHMTLHTKEVNEKLRNKEAIVVVDPFKDPVEDVSDPFYPEGNLGNPNTEPPENPEIVYDPAAEDRAAEESQEPDFGDPTGEHASSYACFIPGTDVQSVHYDLLDPYYDESGAWISDVYDLRIPESARPHTQEECADIGGDWEQISMDINPGPEVTIQDPSEGGVWGKKYINQLPDSSFLYTPPGCGKIDEEGKTKPRSCRTLLYKNKAGKVDLPRLRKVIVEIERKTSWSKQRRADLLRKAKAIFKKEKHKAKRSP